MKTALNRAVSSSAADAELAHPVAPGAVLKSLAAYREDPIAPHVAAILEQLGEDLTRPGLRDTPRRFAKAMRALTAGYEGDVASVVGSGVFASEGDGVVLVRDVEFYSLCEHHLLPFFGRMHVAYLPSDRIIGLSKIPRLAELFARRFQVQERLTEQVADALMELLRPKGVVVMAEARHLCMAMRGVETQHSFTTTRALRGAYATDAQARQEVISMLKDK
jgi:GTP cyclohydrolase I